MDCVTCNGSGSSDLSDDNYCPHCENGFVEIAQCPMEIIDSHIWNVIELADFYEKGLAPVSGGVLEQAAGFIKAAKFIFSEKSYWKNKLGIF